MSKPTTEDILKVLNRRRIYMQPSEIADAFNGPNNYDDYTRKLLEELIELGYVTNQLTQTDKGTLTGYVITRRGIEHMEKQK